MTDKAMLTALLTSGRLTADEETVFRDMLDKLENGKKNAKLTNKQLQWAQSVFDKLDLSAEDGSANLISSGKYVPSADERKKKYAWESARKPRKPPGRTCPEGSDPCKICETCRR